MALRTGIVLAQHTAVAQTSSSQNSCDDVGVLDDQTAEELGLEVKHSHAGAARILVKLVDWHNEVVEVVHIVDEDVEEIAVVGLRRS